MVFFIWCIQQLHFNYKIIFSCNLLRNLSNTFTISRNFNTIGEFFFRVFICGHHKHICTKKGLKWVFSQRNWKIMPMGGYHTGALWCQFQRIPVNKPVNISVDSFGANVFFFTRKFIVIEITFISTKRSELCKAN